MAKLTQQQIAKIIKLRSEGKLIKELAEYFNVSVGAIRYWLYREQILPKIRVYQKNHYREMPKEAKKNYFNRKKPYQRKYHSNRYKNDEVFRKKQIAYSLKWQKEKTKK